MRFIKRYPTEDEFAQQENMSGYPSNAVTTIRPGMAYVLDSKNVYYNEDPIPPLPNLKVWNYVSGLSYQDYSSEDGGENYFLTSERKTYIIFDNPSAVTELTFIEKKRGYDYDNEIMYPWGPFGCARRSSLFYRDDYDNSIGNVASAQLSLPDPITVSQDSVYLLGFNTDTEELDSVSEMYTLGKTVYISPQGSAGESGYKVYYKTGESTSTRYLAPIEYADNNYKYYVYGMSIMKWPGYYVSTDGSDDPNDWEYAYGYILDFSYYSEPDVFPYVFTTKEKEISQNGDTNYEQCTLSPNGLIGVEHVSGSTYKLTKMSWWPFTETEDDEDLISQFNIYFEADKYYAVAYELQDNQTHIAFFELEESPDDDFSGFVDNVQSGFKRYTIKSMTMDGQPYPIPSGENFIEASPYFRSVSESWGTRVFQIEPNNGGLFHYPSSEPVFDWGADDVSPMAFIFRLPLTEGITECEDINPPSATTFVFDASIKKDSTFESLFCVSSDSEMVTEIRPSLHQRENAYLQTIEESQGEIYNDPTSITVTIINAKNLRSSFPETMTITLLKSSSDSYGINYTYQYGHDDFTFRFYYWLPYNEQGDTGSPGGPAIGLTFHMGFS